MLTAQSSAGTEFWLAYMENLNLLFNDDPVFNLSFSAADENAAAQVTVGVPATGFSVEVNVPAGELVDYTLPSAIWYSENSEFTEGKGIRVTSDVPIIVQARHFRQFFTESTSVLPLAELGDDYRALCYTETEPMTGPTSFVIAVTEDGSEIEITPTTFTYGLHAADVPFTVTMDAGDIYQVQADGDLTGSRIRSLNGEKIAVFSGARQSLVGNCGSADNHLYDQCQPYQNWGDLYCLVPLAARNGDVVRILAKEDDTELFLDCGSEIILQENEFYDFDLDAPVVLTASKNVAVSQLSKSNDCSAGNFGDPNMLQLLPTDRMTLRDRWEVAEGTEGSGVVIDMFFSTIIMRTAEAGIESFNGSPLPASEFQPFPGDPTLSYAYATGALTGANEMTSDAPFHVYHYGFGEYDAYTQTGSFQFIENLTPPEVLCNEVEIEGVFCTDSLLTFTYLGETDNLMLTWQTSEGQNAVGNPAEFIFTDAGDFLVTLELTDAGGTTTAENFNISVENCATDCENPDLSAQIFPPANICSDSLLQFDFTAAAAVASALWLLPDGTETTENTAFFTTDNVDEIYEISLTLTDAEGCTDNDTFEFSPLPCVSAADCIPEDSVDIFIELTGPICGSVNINPIFYEQADLGMNIVSAVWELNDGRVFTGFTPMIPTLSFVSFGGTLIATDANGCVYEQVFLYSVDGDCNEEEICEYFFPNVFTPNDDGINDTFRGLSDCTPATFTVSIYGRWGELIFQTDDFTAAWDGTFRGKPVPADVYVYVAEIGTEDGLSEIYRGDVTVLR